MRVSEVTAWFGQKNEEREVLRVGGVGMRSFVRENGSLGAKKEPL